MFNNRNKAFFADDVLLGGKSAKKLYEEVKALPIIDYHCHLDPKTIAEDAAFGDIGSMWLGSDHYKWRAMRLCGVDERYVTGDASPKEKFIKYAEIMPKLCGNPLYYWTHLELKLIFGIREPLCLNSAERIYEKATAALKGKTVADLLSRFGVRYIAMTDDPLDDLCYHGLHGGVTVAPTFRPDKALSLDERYLALLEDKTGDNMDSICGFVRALAKRMDYFNEHGCKISDHGFERFPTKTVSREEAELLYAKRKVLSEEERSILFGHLLSLLMPEYKKRDMVVQLHFGVTRNVKKEEFAAVGADSGYDVISTPPDPPVLIKFLSSASNAQRPEILLYTLNDCVLSSLACVTGAFRNVRMGAAWWFNDTVSGIKRNLETIMEYSVLGTNVGMLIDSRSFSSYARFDFFRRILADVVGKRVDNGEYDYESARVLMRDICYENPRNLVKLQ